jgi:signal transduction histidine kinase
MEFKSSLSQRIVISFVLLTTVISGLFALGIAVSIDVVEESLINDEMKHELSMILEDYQRETPLKLDKSTRFFAGNQQLPAYLQPVAPGFNEIERDNHDYYVYHYQEGNISYYLVRSEGDFEKNEDLIEHVVLTGFSLSIIISYLLGRLLVKKVIAPVQRLTHQVRDRESLLAETPRLASDYADDEVGTLATAFDNTIGKLQQALQRETLFTSDISHELRTPLMIIKSSCDLLAEKGNLDDFSSQRLAMVRKAADEIQQLVAAFLALARGRETNLEKTSLAAVVRSGRAHWKQLAVAKGISFEIQEEIGETRADLPEFPEVLLRTVINNLVRNAIHYTMDGAVTLHLRPDGFTLCDTGSGIVTAEKNDIFKPYYRGENTARSEMGMGIGLSLVQRICEREQWTILLEDNQPNGCCFTVTLH